MKRHLTEKEIVLELESIQRIISKKGYVYKNANLREVLDFLRITAQYIQFDRECLKRELNYAKKKKSEQ
ncbi:hypothetical protein LCGC14_1891740 [marine sediment metagenome]|uniref:Uncharacterized protein n=1 Tax=marine sediment metagenome TaxID=412755 RepID=A0A0F9GMG2_9ZZZZ